MIEDESPARGTRGIRGRRGSGRRWLVGRGLTGPDRAQRLPALLQRSGDLIASALPTPGQFRPHAGRRDPRRGSGAWARPVAGPLPGGYGSVVGSSRRQPDVSSGRGPKGPGSGRAAARQAGGLSGRGRTGAPGAARPTRSACPVAGRGRIPATGSTSCPDRRTGGAPRDSGWPAAGSDPVDHAAAGRPGRNGARPSVLLGAGSRWVAVAVERVERGWAGPRSGPYPSGTPGPWSSRDCRHRRGPSRRWRRRLSALDCRRRTRPDLSHLAGSCGRPAVSGGGSHRLPVVDRHPKTVMRRPVPRSDRPCAHCHWSMIRARCGKKGGSVHPALRGCPRGSTGDAARAGPGWCVITSLAGPVGPASEACEVGGGSGCGRAAARSRRTQRRPGRSRRRGVPGC